MAPKKRVKVSLPKESSKSVSLYSQDKNTYSLKNKVDPFPIMKKKKDIEAFHNTLFPVDEMDANIEAEKGENLLTPDGKNFKVGGKIHEQGGTPLSVEPGSFIFSNKKSLKIKGTLLEEFGYDYDSKEAKKGFTPAELAKKFPTNPFVKMLNSAHSDNLDKETAELMLQNMTKKLGRVALIQEVMKGLPQGGATPFMGQDEEMMAMGGKVEQYEEGGNPKDGKVKAAIANNYNKPFVQRMFNSNVKVAFKDDDGRMGFGSHYMESSDGMVYPRVIDKGGKLQKVSSDEARKYALRTGDFIKFDSEDDALYFSENYKRFTTVENQFAMGGTIKKKNTYEDGGPFEYDPKTGIWKGDKKTKFNAMRRYGSLQQYADVVGYTGPIDLSDQNSIANSTRQIQQFVMQRYPDLVEKNHGKGSRYGMPLAGRPDDARLGVRWEDIASEIETIRKPSPYAPLTTNPNTSLNKTVGLKTIPSVKNQKPTPQGLQTWEDPYRDTGYGMMDYANMGAVFAQPLNKYNPIRTHVEPETIGFNPVDYEAQRQSIKGQVRSFGEVNSAMSPSASMASSRNAGLFAQSLDPLNQSFMAEFNQNQGLRTQTDQFNAQSRMGAKMANAQFDDQYNSRQATVNDNYDQEKRLRLQQFMTTWGGAERSRQARNAMNFVNQDFEIGANGQITRNRFSEDQMMARLSSSFAGSTSPDMAAMARRIKDNAAASGLNISDEKAMDLAKSQLSTQYSDINGDGVVDKTRTTNQNALLNYFNR